MRFNWKEKLPVDPHTHTRTHALTQAGLTLNEEYHFEFFFLTDKAKQDVEQSLTAELIKKDRDPASGLVVLVFKLVFAPFFTMK